MNLVFYYFSLKQYNNRNFFSILYVKRSTSLIPQSLVSFYFSFQKFVRFLGNTYIFQSEMGLEWWNNFEKISIDCYIIAEM